MFYLTQAVGELRKPMILWNETAMILVLLATYLDFRPPIEMVIIVFIVVNLLGVVIGKILKKQGL